MMATNPDGPPAIAEVGARREVMIVIVGILVIIAAIVLKMIGDNGPAPELVGCGVIILWLLFQAVRFLRLAMTLEIDADILRISRADHIVYEGPYFAVKRTVLPLFGVAFAVEPIPFMGVLSLHYSHVFAINAGRNRLALPGLFLTGLDDVWDLVPKGRRV